MAESPPTSDTRNWSGESKGSAWGNRAFLWLISRFGVLPAYALLVPVCISYAFRDKKSSSAIRSFRHHLGLSTSRWHLFRHFFSLGTSLVDRFAFLLNGKVPWKCESNGQEFLSHALQKQKGVILLSAHVGNWEMAGNLLSHMNEVPITIVMLDAEREDIKQVYSAALSKRRVSVINAGTDPLATAITLRQALLRNEIVCMHGDRVVDESQAQVPFLGSPARFPLGPFTLASRLGIPLIPAFVIRVSARQYTISALEPLLDGSETDRTGSVARQALERFVVLLEQTVRRHPYEWHNFYDFWK